MLVSYGVIDLSNVINSLLLAHEKICPLLKEYAMEYGNECYIYYFRACNCYSCLINTLC